MIIAVCVCIMCLASCSSGYTVLQRNGDTVTHYIVGGQAINLKDAHTGTRIKRGLFTAVGLLLKTARFIKKEGNVIEYEKTGGFRQAARDFSALNIENVNDLRLFKWGRVGDRTAVLQYEEGGAEILIWKRGKDHSVNKIIYKD